VTSHIPKGKSHKLGQAILPFCEHTVNFKGKNNQKSKDEDGEAMQRLIIGNLCKSTEFREISQKNKLT